MIEVMGMMGAATVGGSEATSCGTVPPSAQGVKFSPVPYVVTEPCIGVKDKSCMTVCPVDCIYEGSDMVYIQPDECIDCGLCEPECPVNAIFVDTDVPGQWKEYVLKNEVEAKKLSGG